MNDYSDDNSYQVLYTYKDEKRRWVRPAELDIAKPYRAVMYGGYCLDFDGESLLISYTGGIGVGGYDLYESIFSNGKWSAKKNIGAPINSKQNESYPAFSPDGSKLYFTRCDGVADKKGVNCKIMVSERKRGRFKGWNEPVEFEVSKGMVNSMMPRILADEQSMYFMSGEGENRKWYFTRYEDNGWTKPESMLFINAMEGKDFLTVYYRPDMLLTSIKNESGYFNIADIKIPEEFQPLKAVIKTGTITDSEGNPVAAEIRAIDFDTGASIASSSSDSQTGQYTIILPEGNIYDYSIFIRRGAELYHSDILDLQEIRNLRREIENYSLENVTDGKIMPVKAIKYLQYSEEIDERSNLEIRRLSRLLQSNNDYNLKIMAYQDSVVMDSVARLELPLVISDTLITWDIIVQADSINADFPVMETAQIDSMLMVWNDSLAVVKNDSDTLLANLFIASVTGTIDSVENIQINYTYHNNFTTGRAQSLADLLISSGVDAGRIESEGFGDSELPKSEFSKEAMKEGVIEVVFIKR